MVRRGVCLPPFGELADPRVLAELAAAAESAGFDGVFVSDHVVLPQRPALPVCDAWIALAAMATATTRVTLGPRVTPLSRRRPHDVARQAVALDQLGEGRLVLGVGPGCDAGGEFARLGEADAARDRAERLDEALDVITGLWSGEPVRHAGRHYRVDDLFFLPRPTQRPRIPIWVAARTTAPAVMRRAARFDGLFPQASPGELADMLTAVAELRDGLDGYEVAVALPPAADPDPYLTAGATWWLTQLPDITTRRAAVSVIRRGPA